MSDPFVPPTPAPGHASSPGPTSSAPRPKRRRWLRWLGIGSGAFVLLLVIVYFVGTSAAFFKGVILPKVGEAMHATVTVSDASISPFSKVVLRDLKVQTTGTEPLLTAKEARVRYSLWAILGGNLKIGEVAVESPTVVVVRNTNGTSNLDPLKGPPDDASKKKPASGSGSSKTSQPLQIDLARFALNNATVRMITLLDGGRRDLVEVSGLNITLDNLKNGQTGKLAVSAGLAVDKQPDAPAQPGGLQGKLETTGELTLGQDLSLSLLKLHSRVSVPQATGSLKELTGSTLSLDTDLSADPAKQSAILRSLNLTAERANTTLLKTFQSGPLTVSWGGNAPTASDAALTIVLTNLNLADWKGFAPEFDPAGRAHGTVELSSQESGKNVQFRARAAVDGLGAKVGTNSWANLQLTLTAAGRVSGFNQVSAPEVRLALSAPDASLVSVDANISADLAQNTADVEAKMEADLARLLAMLPAGGMTLKSGQAQFNTKVARRNLEIKTTGTMQLKALTGKFGERPFQDLALASTYDVTMANPQQIDLRSVQIALAPTDRARTNAATLSGHLDTSNPNAIEGKIKLAADTLDVTAYYDLFDQSSAPRPGSRPSTGQPKPNPPPPDNQPEVEPPAMQLPVKLVTGEIQISRCFLRELILSEVTAAARVETNRILLDPISAKLNGAPLTAKVDVNVGVPGYQYEIGFLAKNIPIEPLANSFSPEYRGQAKGDFFAAVDLKGAGVTGPSLQKNLGGALQLNFTNAEIQLVGTKAKAMLTPIAVGLGYPEIFSSPLRWLGADAKISDGKVQLNQFSLVSPAFIASTRGEIPLANNLSQSPIRNWPVDFALPRALAERLKLTKKDGADTNAFVSLPNFVQAVGTVGNAGTKVDSVALLQFGARTLTEIPGVGKDATKFINQADSLLGGRLTGNTNRTNQATTNAPSTNDPANSFRKLGDLLKPKTK